MIPFIHVELSGKKVGAMIVRDAQTETLAARFISLGGRYVIEDQFGGKVRIAATIPHKDKPLEVESLTETNGLGLPKAIDQLIRLSDLHVSEMWIGDEGDLKPMAEA